MAVLAAHHLQDTYHPGSGSKAQKVWVSVVRPLTVEDYPLKAPTEGSRYMGGVIVIVSM